MSRSTSHFPTRNISQTATDRPTITTDINQKVSYGFSIGIQIGELGISDMCVYVCVLFVSNISVVVFNPSACAIIGRCKSAKGIDPHFMPWLYVKDLGQRKPILILNYESE